MHSFIKWTGSKRIQSDWILSMFPKFSGRYCEMFLGSGIVMLAYLKRNPNAECIANDLCLPLIRLWEACRDKPDGLSKDYKEMWVDFNSKDRQWRKDFFGKIRNEFNSDQSRVSHFLFLTRTSINGLVRFNSKGLYNSPSHFTRPGIDPERMDKLLRGCSAMIQNVDFRCGSYESVELKEDDFCYMDPPYASTGNAMYFGNFDNEKYYAYVERMPCRWLMSYDGLANSEVVAELPRHLYRTHLLRRPTISTSFNALYGCTGRKRMVEESLYGNFEISSFRRPSIDLFC